MLEDSVTNAIEIADKLRIIVAVSRKIHES